MKHLKFLNIVKEIAALSKDPSTKVGALAFDDQMNIIATGYNGFPRGVNDDPARYNDRPTKYKLISHSEQNLVAQAAYSGHSLAGSTVFHLKMTESELLAGETMETARQRWAEFLRPADVLCGWGRFTAEQLEEEALATGPWLDLRTLAAQRLKQSPGAPPAAAAALGAAPPEPLSGGRAERTVSQLSHIVRALLAPHES